MIDPVTRFSGAHKNRLLGKEEEISAARAWLERGDDAARLLLIETHAKLVGREARKISRDPAIQDDLFSEGLTGLLVAIDRFDPEAGFRLSTYAMHWIRASMTAYMLTVLPTLRIPMSWGPRKVAISYARAAAAIRAKATRGGRSLSNDEIDTAVAEALGVDIDLLRATRAAFAAATPLDAPAFSDDPDGGTLADTLADAAPTPEDRALARDLDRRVRDDVSEAIATLSPRERHIIETRKMADDDAVLTLEDLSQVHGVSRERIRQIEVKALEKLSRRLAPTGRLMAA